MNTAVMEAALLPGLVDPVFDSQTVFRAALEAFSHPGRVVPVGVSVCAPATLAPATVAFLLTMADFETPVWLQHHDAAVVDYLRFHCGAPITDEPSRARFAVIADPLRMPPLDVFDPGEPEYPDRSATLLVQARLTAGVATVRLRGPGIDGAAELGVADLPDDFWPQWRRNDALFPCGVDVVFADVNALCALPRTSQAEVACTSR